MRGITPRLFASATALAAVCLLPACAVKQQPRVQPQQFPVDVDHLFTVVVVADERSKHKCAIKVTPDGPEVKIKRGARVGWNVVNLCDTEAGLKLDFKFQGNSRPILKEPRTSGALFTGKIKSRFKKCHDEAPCGLYKYDVQVGKHFVDPEFEIVY